MIFFENCVSLIEQWNKLLLSACKYMDDHQLRIICAKLWLTIQDHLVNVIMKQLTFYISFGVLNLSKLILACSWMIH